MHGFLQKCKGSDHAVHHQHQQQAADQQKAEEQVQPRGAALGGGVAGALQQAALEKIARRV